MSTVPIVAIDTETTGLHTDKRVWEVAMIRRDDDGERELLLQVRDVDLSNADGYGLKVGGFYDRHVQYAPRWKDGGDRADVIATSEESVARCVEQWTRGAHLVGVNPAFDAGCLDPMLRRHGLLPAWHYHLVDVGAMAMGYLHGCEQSFELSEGPPTLPWKSDALGAALDVEPASEADRHTALGDARWALRMWDAMTGAAA